MSMNSASNAEPFKLVPNSILNRLLIQNPHKVVALYEELRREYEKLEQERDKLKGELARTKDHEADCKRMDEEIDKLKAIVENGVAHAQSCGHAEKAISEDLANWKRDYDKLKAEVTALRAEGAARIKQDERINTMLKAEVERLRKALKYVRTNELISDRGVDVVEDALSGEKGKEDAAK